MCDDTAAAHLVYDNGMGVRKMRSQPPIMSYSQQQQQQRVSLYHRHKALLSMFEQHCRVACGLHSILLATHMK
jgi:hypothetical protein